MIMVPRSMSSRTTIKNAIIKYIKSVNKFKKIGEYFTPDDIALFIAKSIEGIIGDENSLSLVDPMAGSCNLIHEVLWNSNVKNKINWNNIYLNRFYIKNPKEPNEIFEAKNLDGNIYGRAWGPKLQKNITKIDIENYEQKGDLVIVNLDVSYLGNHKIIQKLTDKYCFILDTNSPKNKIDWDNVNFSIEKIIDLGDGVGVGGKHYYLYIYSRKTDGEKDFGNAFYKFNGEYQKYNGDIFREKKEELILGNKSFDKLIEKSSLEEFKEESQNINKLINQIYSSNKIITTNFSKLLGNLSISWTPETQTKITDIITEIQNSPQKIQSSKLYEILTALTVSNFLILSGPSGVGKTSLVEKISNAIGGNFKKSPIKSNFTDESGLLGYYNPLLSRYEGTEVLEFIFESSQNTQIPYFLLLDEMNLSRIENYFSEFLARIDEIKTQTGAEIKLFDVLVDSKKKLKNINYFIEKYSLDDKQVTVKNGSFEDLQKEYKSDEEPNLQVEIKINLYSNLHIVGTINEDETTNSISNKVLDRAFYISLEVNNLFEEKEKIDINYILNSINKFQLSKKLIDTKSPFELEKNIYECIKQYGNASMNENSSHDVGFDILQKIETKVHNLDILYNVTSIKGNNINYLKNKKTQLRHNLNIYKSENQKICFLVVNGLENIDIEDNIIIVGYELFDSFIELFFKFIFHFKDVNYRDITSKNILVINKSQKELENYKGFITEINKKIQEINKNDAIGYRALQDIATFIKNYKENLNNFDEKKTLDLVFCSKVWPKIKNYSIMLNKKEKFEELKEIVGKYLLKESESYKFLDGLDLFN